jgi:alkaline phosphatase
MQLSASALWRRLGEDKTPENIQAAVQKYWGINLSSKDAQEILELSRQYGKEGHYALGEVISLKYTYLGWTTHGHTGGDIPLYAFGPHRPVGLLDAPEIGRICARTLGLDLEKLTDRLFAEARQFFPKDAVQLDRANPKNPAVRISYQERQAELPVNTNILNLDGRQVDLEGIVVYIPETDKIYIPLQAVHLLKGESKALPAFAK